jgi:membrane protein implicated in regulation of membrane protease activity
MQWLISSLMGIGLSLMTYGFYLAWPPVAFVIAGAVFLRIAWNVDGGNK